MKKIIEGYIADLEAIDIAEMNTETQPDIEALISEIYTANIQLDKEYVVHPYKKIKITIEIRN